MDYQKMHNVHTSIIALLDECIANEKLIDELLEKIDAAEPILISEVPDYSFKGAELLRDLAIYRNRNHSNDTRIRNLMQKFFEQTLYE